MTRPIPHCLKSHRQTGKTGQLLEGVGLHSGEPARLHFFPLASRDIRFEFESLSRVNTQRDLRETALSARNGTILSCRGGELRTPEHLLGVLAGFSSLGIRLQLNGKEFPGVDGSGRFFLEALNRLFGAAKLRDSAAFEQYPSEIETSYDCSDGWYHVKPAHCFSVRYEVAVGSLRQVCMLDLADSNHIEFFLYRIIPSKTFITWKNYLRCRGAGLLKGASENSGLLLAESRKEWRKALSYLALSGAAYPFLNVEGLRWDGELAAHKILDLLGDLALNGPGLPKLALEIKNGGHFQNHQLVKDLRNENTKYSTPEYSGFTKSRIPD